MSTGHTPRSLATLHQEEDGLATAEYGIVMLATVPMFTRIIEV